MNNFKYFLNEASDRDTQINDYLEQVSDKNGWKPITDEIYDGIEEEGWINDLTEDMDDATYDANVEIIKSGFVYKELELYYLWQNEHIKNGYEYTTNILNRFDDVLKSSQSPPYHTLTFIDSDKGKVYIIKYKKPIALS
jgi:hypothetical protein